MRLLSMWLYQFNLFLKWSSIPALFWLLCWFFAAISDELTPTNFKDLRVLFWPIALIAGGLLLLKLLGPNPTDRDIPLRVDRAMIGLAFANIAIALLAIWAAKLINPQHQFRSPLLELCNRLTKNF